MGGCGEPLLIAKSVLLRSEVLYFGAWKNGWSIAKERMAGAQEFSEPFRIVGLAHRREGG